MSDAEPVQRFAADYWKQAPIQHVSIDQLPAGIPGDEEFRLLADNIPTLCWIANGDGYIVWYNRRWHEYCGSSPAEMEGWGWQAVHDPDVLPQVMERWTASIASGEPFEMTFPLRGADGMFRPFLTRVQPVRDESGDVVRWFGVNTDVSATVAAQQLLHQSEERLRLIQAAGKVGSFDYDLRSQEATCSAEYLDIMGLPPGTKVTLESAKAIVHPDDLEGALAALDQAIADRAPFQNEYRIIRPDTGETRWIANSALLVFDETGAPERYVGGVVDITDRRQAISALARSESWLRAVLDSSTGGFYCVDRTGDTTLVSRGFLAMMGFASEQDVIGRKLHNLIHHHYPDGRAYPVEECPIYQCASTSVSAYRPEELFFREDGTAVPVEYWVSPLTEDGRHVGAICTIVDLTERKRMEAARAETEERYRLAARATKDAIWDWDLVGNHVLWNDALYEVFGHSAEDVEPTGDWWVEQIHPDERERVSHEIHQVIDGDGHHWQSEYRFRTAEGDYRYVFDRGFVIRDAQGRAIRMIGAMLDQTDRRRAEATLRQLNETLEQRVREEVELRSQAEEALRQSQKMETVGQLTGGIAHDFNNLLQVINGNLDLLMRRVPDEHAELRRFVDRAKVGAERAATLTQRLLAFSRRQPLDPKPVEVNRLLSGMSELLHRSLGETVEVETVLAARLWTVEVDPNQLENAIINLAVNARDAMPDGGKLTIETQNCHLDESYAAQFPGLSAGQYMLISISDTGVGMDEEVAAKAIEPFFTTKEVGKGTGLGLSMVYGFIKQSGGHLRIYSEPGQGTTVKLYLPRLIGDASISAEHETMVPAEGGGSECILVCEDDEDVRTFSVEILRELGYQVLEASDGPTALRIVAKQKGRIDLLFTDVVLPGGMTGAVLAREATELQPGLKVLFTTGYARNAIVHQGRLDPGVELITKPFSSTDLAAKIRQVLDSLR